MARMFGTDGVRGVAGTELTIDLAMKLGQAGAYVLTKEQSHQPTIIVGCDTRISGGMLANALMAGICSVGANAIYVGVAPTPAIAYLTRKHKVDAGVVISASHNPMEFNGIKFFNGEGYKLSDQLEDEIEALIRNDMEDVVFPAIEMQDEFTFDKLLEHYCGYPVSNMDDLKHAKTIFNQTSKERKQRLSELRYNANDYVDDDDMYRRISRFKWSAPENRGHYKTIKGVRWFDDFILEKLKGERMCLH